MISRSISIFCGRLTLAAACVVAAVAPSGCDKPSGAASPKAAAVSFAHAVEASDMQAARQFATGTDAEFALAADLGQMIRATNRFNKIAIDRYGDDARSFEAKPADVVADFESAVEKIEGSKATLVTTGRVETNCVNDGSGWKVDLKFLDHDDAALQSSKKLSVQAKALDAIAADIESGAIHTTIDMKAALVQRFYMVDKPAGSAKP